MRSRAAALVLVLLLAGCSTVGGPSAPGETVTPAPVPTPETATPEATTPTPTPVPQLDGSVPPLTLTAGSEVDAVRLAANHRAVLRNRSYRMTKHHRRVVTRDGAVVRQVSQTERIWVAGDGVYRYDLARETTTTDGSSWYNRSLYADGNRTLLFVEEGGQRAVSELDSVGNSERFAEISAELVRRYLTNPEQSVTERDGRFLIRGEGSAHPDQTFTTNNTARAVVEPNGLVVNLSASYQERARVGPRRVSESFTITDADGVPEPDWVNETAD